MCSLSCLSRTENIHGFVSGAVRHRPGRYSIKERKKRLKDRKKARKDRHRQREIRREEERRLRRAEYAEQENEREHCRVEERENERQRWIAENERSNKSSRSIGGEFNMAMVPDAYESNQYETGISSRSVNHDSDSNHPTEIQSPASQNCRSSCHLVKYFKVNIITMRVSRIFAWLL